MNVDNPGRPEQQPRVLAIGPLPPFVGGAAKNTAIICDTLEARGAQVIRLPTNKTRSRAEHSRSPGVLADRAAGFLTNLGRMLAQASIDRRTTVYLVPDGGPGVISSVAYVRLAKPRFERLIVHHRNYSHLRQRSTLMGLLMRTSPARTVHVFLDPVMERRFKEIYPSKAVSIYVPNAATCDVAPAPAEARSGERGPLTIGFLSNLVEDKGFDLVVEAFPKLADRFGSETRFLLAGRPVGTENEERLRRLQLRLGDRLNYLGEIGGQVKTDFFQSCDVFVFPTRFPQEAQPNVLYEAMAGGAAIVSTRWAGVPWLLEGAVHRLIEPGAGRCEDLVDAVADIVDSGQLSSARQRQIEVFAVKKSDADARYSRLLEILLGQ